MERPWFLSQIYVHKPTGRLAHSGHKRASQPVIQRVTGAGIRQVHDRSITSPRQVNDRLRRIQSLTGDIGNPWCMTPRLAAVSSSGHSAARHGVVLVFHPSGGDTQPVPSVEPR